MTCSGLGLVVEVREFLLSFALICLATFSVSSIRVDCIFTLKHLAAGEGQEHLPLLDNISWKSISQKLGTRNENMAGLSI